MKEIVFNNIPMFIASKKINMVARLIRKKNLFQALRILSFGQQKGSFLLKKLLLGASKTIEKENENSSVDFYISKLLVNQGQNLKRKIYRGKAHLKVKLRRSSLVTCVITKNN